MKLILGLSLLLVVLSLAESRFYHSCPTTREGCSYTLDLNPVCSTLGCPYSNIRHMKCAGGKLWYTGECKAPYNGWNN